MALQSVKRQTSNDFETILVSNADYEIQADVYVDDTLAYACNRGIERAEGEYIMRVDADDWIEPELVEIESNYLDNHPEIDAVWCDFWASHPVEGEDHTTYYLEPHENEELEHACGVMYRKKCWEAMGGYREDLEYQESFEFWLRFQQQFRVARLALPLYFYRQHDSMSSNPEREETRARILSEYED